MNTDPTVFVIEGQAAFDERPALAVMLHGFPVRTFPSCEAFLDGLLAGTSGCVVVDIGAGRMTGADLPKVLADRGHHLPTIIVIGENDLKTAVAAMKRGAADVIERPVVPELLASKVRNALADERRRTDCELAAWTIRQRVARLTRREREVMDLVASGLPNKSIARRLGIGHRTVEVHRAHLMEKLRADSSAELIFMALLARGVSAALQEWAVADCGPRQHHPLAEQLLPAD